VLTNVANPHQFDCRSGSVFRFDAVPGLTFHFDEEMRICFHWPIDPLGSRANLRGSIIF
jgi:hypothetical protein